MSKNGMAEVAENENVFEEAMSPPLTAEQLAEIHDGNEALAQALANEPGMMADLEGLIAEVVRRPITPDSVQELYNGLLYFLDPSSIDYLFTILTGDNYGPFLDAVEEEAGPETWRWLRRLLAFYSGPLREAYSISGESPNAWRWLNRRVYYDNVTNRWGINLELIKLNGERLGLEETPLSALGLAHGIVDSLNNVPAEAASSLLDEEVVEQFMNQCLLFQERYLAEKVVDVPAVVT